MSTIEIDEYSLSTISIQMFFQETPLSYGTGFIWAHGDSLLLITNWHNLSGKNSVTGEHLSHTTAEPDRIELQLPLSQGRVGRTTKMIPIRGEQGDPLWTVHPQYGSAVDIAAIQVPQFSDVDFHPINNMGSMDLAVMVGMDVFVLGYPFGRDPIGLPIWKRGSVASEPKIIRLDRPTIFIDTASRPGMSGSPILRRSWGSHMMESGGYQVNGASETKFVGIYSGRLASTDEMDAQLGIAWPAYLVRELVELGGQE